jgi:hypothetical protein
VFDFSSQPQWPNWHWLFHELKFYAATAALCGLGFVVISALVFGSGWDRFTASGVALAAILWGIKKWLLDAEPSWKPALPRTEPFPRPIASPDSWGTSWATFATAG